MTLQARFAFFALLLGALPAQSSGSELGASLQNPDGPITQQFVYRTVGDRELAMKLWYPAEWKPGSPKLPASVMIFGGGWYAGDIAQFNGIGNGKRIRRSG